MEAASVILGECSTQIKTSPPSWISEGFTLQLVELACRRTSHPDASSRLGALGLVRSIARFLNEAIIHSLFDAGKLLPESFYGTALGVCFECSVADPNNDCRLAAARTFAMAFSSFSPRIPPEEREDLVMQWIKYASVLDKEAIDIF